MYAVAYHGTTRNFDAFDLSYDRGDNWFGRGVYLSSEKQDCLRNYNQNGGDNRSRVEEYVYQNECSREEAKAALFGSTELLLTCAITLKNPLHQHETFYIECSSRRFENIIQHMYSLGYQFDRQLFVNDVLMPMVEGTNINSFKESVSYLEPEHEDYEYPNPEFGRDLLCCLGYDGVIMNASETFPFLIDGMGVEEVTHYIVFNCKQVKIVNKELMEWYNHG